MNIYDVSRRAGVSIATVSRVLNGNPNVSEKTRTKVLTVMDELGYTPNVFARGLGLGTMKTIGIMCSDSSDPYLANAIYFLERELRANGYDSILCCTGTSLDTNAMTTRPCTALPPCLSDPAEGTSCTFTPAIPTAASIRWRATKTR